jgi:hypothetical protein
MSAKKIKLNIKFVIVYMVFGTIFFRIFLNSWIMKGRKHSSDVLVFLFEEVGNLFICALISLVICAVLLKIVQIFIDVE